jgi:protein ImuB
MSRIACLAVPLFPLAARLRSEPDLTGEALAIFQGNGSAARLVAASRRARRSGIRPGMSPVQARAILPKLTVRGRDPLSEHAAHQALLEIAESFSPRVEDATEGVVYLQLDGLERHFPGDTPEEDLGHALINAAGKAGLTAWSGIASSKLAARVAAEQPSSPTIVTAGTEAPFLAPLPLDRLSPEAEVLATLERWGIRSLGELARLSANEVASRLGPAGQRLHQQARGLDPRPLVPYRPPPAFEEGLDLDWPLTTLEPFLFVARAALDRLCRRLVCRGLACSRLDLSLRLDPDGWTDRELRLPAPTTQVKTLLTLLRLALEDKPPDAPVTAFSLSARPDRPREAQLSLFGPAAPSPDRLATTLARLFTLLGPDRLGSPPEPQGRGLLSVRSLRPPLPIEVLSDGPTARERPAELRAVVAEETSRRPRIEGPIRVASGPWRLEEEWWQEQPVTRDYWDVELHDGGLYRLYRERSSGEWFVDGIYD